MVNFVHYHEDKSETLKTTNDVDVYWNEMKKYTIDKYTSRLKRMMPENTWFVICDNKTGFDFSYDEIKDVLAIKDKKIVLFTDKNGITSTDNVEVIHESGLDHEKCARIFFERFKDLI